MFKIGDMVVPSGIPEDATYLKNNMGHIYLVKGILKDEKGDSLLLQVYPNGAIAGTWYANRFILFAEPLQETQSTQG